MGYSKANGQWADTVDAELVASAARTATFQSAALEIGDRGTACLTLDVTAVSGTAPTLDVAIETSADGTTWRALASFAQKTVAGSERKSFVGCDRFIRANCTIAGTTPSFTFSVAGEAK